MWVFLGCNCWFFGGGGGGVGGGRSGGVSKKKVMSKPEKVQVFSSTRKSQKSLDKGMRVCVFSGCLSKCAHSGAWTRKMLSVPPAYRVTL